jgi:hypothetical protein
VKPQLCPMCRSADCEAVVNYPEPCPTYFTLREALLPAHSDLSDDTAHALFWLAQQVGATETRARKWQLRELVSLFVTARRTAFRAADAARVAQPAPRGGWQTLVKALRNVPLTIEEQRTLGWLFSCEDATVDDLVSIVIKATAWPARAETLH